MTYVYEQDVLQTEQMAHEAQPSLSLHFRDRQILPESSDQERM